MNTPWSELPNAHHIDWVLESVKQNPQLWSAAWDEAERRRPDPPAPAWDEAWYAAWRSARSTAHRWVAADEALLRLMDAAARTAVLALVAYDDCDQYLNMSYEKLYVYAMLCEKPQALLLLPMVYLREKLNEQALG